MYKKEFRQRSISTNHWYDLSIGLSNAHIAILYLVQRDEITIEFYINDDKSLFEQLISHRNEIENEIGCALDWRKLPDKKASRILLTQKFDLSDESLLNSEFDWIMEYTTKYKKAFLRYCK